MTGIGSVSCLGHNTPEAWNLLISGHSRISRLSNTSYDTIPSKVAAQIPLGSGKGEFNVNDHFHDKQLRAMAPGTVFAVVAAREALKDAQWSPQNQDSKQRTGVAVGMGMVSLNDICATNDALKTRYNRVSPYFVPKILLNMAAGHISMEFGFQGPNHAVSTACATGAHAIGDGFRFIQNAFADVMVCGAAESCITPLSVAGFCRIRALSTAFNDFPEQSSRPFDKKRDGFVIGEGAAIVVLEELSHAISRNAKIYAEVLGYGLSGDAAHLTAPQDDGHGAKLAMRMAVKDAGLNLADVSYINAHATSTPLGDGIELKAIKSVLKNHTDSLIVSSTKGAHGHLLGASGSLEAVFTILACKNGIIPPTINLDEACLEAEGIDLVPNQSKKWEGPHRRIALKNSFGFGGTNACLCLGEIVP